jgi:hypothetical protein
VPFYSKNKEGITSFVKKKREEGIRSKAQEMRRFPRPSMAKLLPVNG